MKLWIDDLREPPTWYWNVARTSDQALKILGAYAASKEAYRPVPVLEEISFDHDLGGNDTTRRVMLWMIENDVWPERIVVHSMNPVGKSWLLGTAIRYAPNTVQIAS